MNYFVTGNEYVSLPTIREDNAAVESITFLHMGAKGMIELAGTSDVPLLIPVVYFNGKEIPFEDIRWERRHYWIPQFSARAGHLVIEGVYLAPIGERGFGIRLAVSGDTEEINFGIKGCWGKTFHSINESKLIDTPKYAYESGWNHAFVMDQRAGLPLLAFAPLYTEHPEKCSVEWYYAQSGDDITFQFTEHADKNREFVLWFGLGFEEVAAATSAKEMFRHGWDVKIKDTEDWLATRERTVGDAALDDILNLNLFFSYFFGGGETLDTEEFVLVTSRSPRYYVSAAYWDRDSLLWSFPAILLADPETARQMLNYVFTRQIRNVGIHSRYIDGTVLEPGFELDELCAPVIALARYVEETDDHSILKNEAVRAGIEIILKKLASKRHPEIGLYETFLQPTDDMRTYPYLTYNNVLVWYILKKLSTLYPEYEHLEIMAEQVKSAILQHLIQEKNGRAMFVWSSDLEGGWDIYDEPPGSLLLLPFYGFSELEDPVWKNTTEVIRHRDYEFSFADYPIAEIGCRHAPYPWVLSIANSLLSGEREKAKRHLMLCRFDNGIACESVDPVTGESRTGNAFATCAGFLAFAIDTAFDGKRVNESEEVSS